MEEWPNECLDEFAGAGMDGIIGSVVGIVRIA